MTPQDLLTSLNTLPPDAPLVFETSEGAITGGYHVTEWKLTDVQSIDCGASVSSWREASLQLLDGAGGAHMTVRTFTAILTQSIARLDGLGTSAMQVEFAHGNHGKRIYGAAAPVSAVDQITITLTDQSALCKPAEAFRAAMAKERATGGARGNGTYCERSG